MRAGGRLPNDQAEIVFHDTFVNQLDALPKSEQIDVLTRVSNLCADPGGKHPLGTKGGYRGLVGWNTLEVCGGEKRVVYRVDEPNALILVLCVGPRRNNEVYTIADALTSSGLLTDDELTQLWEGLAIVEALAEEVGLDGWDYAPEPAPDGMVKAVAMSGLLPEHVARLLSKDELQAAMAGGWTEDGIPDPAKALREAFLFARSGVAFDSAQWLAEQRMADRCGAPMPRARASCVRRVDHPGPHRAS
ncbi:type II toxin-antitoxin system RelE family toxin [Occultella kanbiaonis]|uniref:type II toxin-antitoxin system RelE family toxin n=1 Tax=Occultella kanbiaonis TaxID=2675754 RepID=UPI0013D04167|nr:hypothetical protein [Occultella kanbiaonis]